MEINKVVKVLLDLMINTSAASKYVKEIEHRIRIIKEKYRANLSAMPFKPYLTS